MPTGGGARPRHRAAPFVLSSADHEHKSINLYHGTTVLCRHEKIAATFRENDPNPDVRYIGLSDYSVDSNHLTVRPNSLCVCVCLYVVECRGGTRFGR